MGQSAVEQRMVSEVSARQEAMAADLAAFVEIPTGPGSGMAGLEELRGMIADRAEKLGAKIELVQADPRPEWLYREPGESSVQKVPATAVCRKEGGLKRPVMICGHLDTVHHMGLTFRSLTRQGGTHRALGPGCADMKGGLVIALHVLEVMAELGVDLGWSLVLNSDEETGSFGSARVIRAEAERMAGRGGYGVAIEPSLPDGSIVVSRPGSGQFVLEARGKSAHVGRDFSAGASAVTTLADAMVKVAELADAKSGRIVNIGPISGGTTTNAVPERASAWGNFRFFEVETGARIVEGLREIAATPRVPGTTLRLESIVGRPAKPETESVREMARMYAAIGGELGVSVKATSTGGVCDGNLMQEAGLPTLDTLGVVGGSLHTTDEWMDLESLSQRAEMLGIFLLRMSS